MKMQVWFYELFQSHAQLSIGRCKQGKAINGLLSKHFPTFYLREIFHDGISDASEGCHVSQNRCLYFLKLSQVLPLNGRIEVVSNQLVNTNLCQPFVVFGLRVIKFFLKIIFQHAISNKTCHNSCKFLMNGRTCLL